LPTIEQKIKKLEPKKGGKKEWCWVPGTSGFGAGTVMAGADPEGKKECKFENLQN
jgi:hypothetical protein